VVEAFRGGGNVIKKTYKKISDEGQMSHRKRGAHTSRGLAGPHGAKLGTKKKTEGRPVRVDIVRSSVQEKMHEEKRKEKYCGGKEAAI